jgi:hypothetical protein
MRFGFIADELESVVPQVVRTVGDQQVADQKAVVYQDLIALLFSGAQSLAGTATSQRQRIDALAAGIEEVKAKLQTLAAPGKEAMKLGEGLGSMSSTDRTPTESRKLNQLELRRRLEPLQEGDATTKVSLMNATASEETNMTTVRNNATVVPLVRLSRSDASAAPSIASLEQELLNELRLQLHSERKALAALKSRLQAAKEARWGKEREASHSGTWTNVLQRRRTSPRPVV